MELERGPNYAFEQITDQHRRGEGEDPCPDDSFDDCPFHAAETFDGADTHDGSGNDVGGGKRNAVETRALNNKSGRRFGRKPVHGLQFHNAMAKRTNDAPTARGCAGGHG